jgi:hypothetical protein
VKKRPKKKRAKSVTQPTKPVPVALPAHVESFIRVLTVEFEAARKQARSTAVPLRNGKLVRRMGGQFVYGFQIENELFVPEDSPADLHLQGREPINATVVAVEGLSIILAVSEHLGDFVAFARLQTDFSQLLKRLIERLKERALRPNYLGDLLLTCEPVVGKDISVSDRSLNPGQNAALSFSLGHNLTFILGPPGTGKSHVIGAIGRQLLRTNRRALIVSHTNSAVDEALLRIVARHVDAEVPDQALTEGAVVRVGQPRTKKLEDRLLLRSQVNRRVGDLREFRLAEEAKGVAERTATVNAIIAVAELVGRANDRLRALEEYLSEIVLASAGEESAQKQLTALQTEWITFEGIARATREGLACEAAYLAAERVEQAIASRVLDADEAFRNNRRALDSARSTLAEVERAQWMHEAVRKLPTVAEASVRTAQAGTDLLQATGEFEDLKRKVEQAKREAEEVSRAGWLKRKTRAMPTREEAVARAKALYSQCERAHAKYEDAWKRHQKAEETLQETRNAEWMRDTLKKLPSMAQAQRDILDEESKCISMKDALGRLTHERVKAGAESKRLREELNAFEKRHGGQPSIVWQRIANQEARMKEAEEIVNARTRALVAVSDRFDGEASQLASDLRRAGFPAEEFSERGTAVSALSSAIDRAQVGLAGVDVAETRLELVRLEARAREISVELAEIEAKQRLVELEVIAQAQIVGATLTASYMRESLKAGGFDTVILDEASMAPIPALWYAAGLGDKAVVIVGDPKQLPPIVIAETKGSVAAEEVAEVLGKDIFCGSPKWRHTDPQLRKLSEQWRMHPQISAIANELSYDGILRNAPPTASDSAEFSGWFQAGAGFDSPVTLVNTNSLNAWVSAVNRGGRSSRLNFLSAALCVEIASQVLRQDRDAFDRESSRRIAIVSPYRPHAALVSLMLRGENLDGEVVAGTAHSFQGSEADVVILDLVNDEPHWKVGMFMPQNDDQWRRLLNVAVTRARRRLVVVGDLDYVSAKAKRAFVGDKFLSLLLRRHKAVDARYVAPNGVAARAARMAAGTREVSNETVHERLVTTEEEFFPLFARDIAGATKRVVVFSPFATKERVAWCDPLFREAKARGVSVAVVTKARKERSRNDVRAYTDIETHLEALSVKVVYKYGMHEKVVLIDDDVIWTGSLNALSFSNTREVMERRRSKEIVSDYVDQIMPEELLDEIPTQSKHICPACNEDTMAWREGKSGPYWQCLSEGCKFTSNPGDTLGANGELRCRSCKAALEFGEWGDRPAWRCVSNPRHRARFSKAHLKLPAMRARLTPEQLRDLELLPGDED